MATIGEGIKQWMSEWKHSKKCEYDSIKECKCKNKENKGQ